MKLYPLGQKTDTELRMEKKKEEIINKWKITLHKEEKTIPGRNHERKIIITNDNPIVLEKCSLCNEFKPLYDYYLRNNYMDVESSKENINNDEKNPCRECSKLTRKEKINNNTDAYITRLLYNYPKLTKKWYQDQIEKNGGLFSSIIGVPLTAASSGCWQVSIQNNRRDLEHLPENCEIISLEENIPQHNAIPDLKIAFTELFTEMVEQLKEPDSKKIIDDHSRMWEDRYKLTPAESGIKIKSRENGKISKEYDRELQQKHLKSMFTCDAKAAYARDKNSKRQINENERIYEKDVFNIGQKQAWKCFKSGVKLSMNRNSWNYPSLERLDNSLNHTNQNTVLICRLLNSTDRAQWSSEKLNYALKYQKLVDVPDEIKQFENENKQFNNNVFNSSEDEKNKASSKNETKKTTTKRSQINSTEI